MPYPRRSGAAPGPPRPAAHAPPSAPSSAGGPGSGLHCRAGPTVQPPGPGTRSAPPGPPTAAAPALCLPPPGRTGQLTGGQKRMEGQWSSSRRQEDSTPFAPALHGLCCRHSPSPTRSSVSSNQISLSVLKDYFVSAKEQWVTGPHVPPRHEGPQWPYKPSSQMECHPFQSCSGTGTSPCPIHSFNSLLLLPRITRSKLLCLLDNSPRVRVGETISKIIRRKLWCSD